MLEALKSLFRRKQEPDVRRNLIFLDSSKLEFQDINKLFICHELYKLASERGLSCSLVDIPEYLYNRAQAVGRFGDSVANIANTFEDEKLTKLAVKMDMIWLVQHRNRLLKEAFESGGDAEYVFMIFIGEPLDPAVLMDPSLNRRVIKLNYVSYADTNLGDYGVVSHNGENTFFRMNDDTLDPSDVIPILNHIVKVCSHD